MKVFMSCEPRVVGGEVGRNMGALGEGVEGAKEVRGRRGEGGAVLRSLGLLGSHSFSG